VFCLVLLCVLFCFVLCVFVVDYDSSASNEYIVRFKCGGRKLYPFTHIFVKIFQFLYSFSRLRKFLYFFKVVSDL